MRSKMGARGVTLVEVMISLLVLLIVFMGLIQAAILSINHNLRNEARDEAVRIAAEYMAKSRADSWNSLAATGAWTLLWSSSRNFRNLSVPYSVSREIEDMNPLDPNKTKRISVSVNWQYPGDYTTLSHTIRYVMRNPLQ